MTHHHDREALSDDSPSLLFGDGYDDDGYDLYAEDDPYAGESRAARRAEERANQRRHRRNGRLLALVAALIVAVVAIVAVPRIVDHFRVKDYSGSGTGSVPITVHTGDNASDIADTLVSSGVVESKQAFVDAASGNSNSSTIQPGVYTLHLKMSAKNALTLLLDPSSRAKPSSLLVPEGATSLDVQTRLTNILGASQKDEIAQALASPAELDVPLGYAPAGAKAPTTVEGFLYPATYTVESSDTAQQALQAMVERFIQQDRNTNFAQAAKALKITPYQALIIASIAQSEAKYDADMPKVVAVILNRIKAGKPLQIDATSAYAAKLQGLDPTKVDYSTIPSPYNTYLHSGLPPAPISNPGAVAMNAAVHPAEGNWLYYVNGDKAGHLYFTHDQDDFTAHQQKCHDQNWGCAAP